MNNHLKIIVIFLFIINFSGDLVWCNKSNTIVGQYTKKTAAATESNITLNEKQTPCKLKNGIYVNSCEKRHTIEFYSSNGNNGMGQFVFSITDKFITKKGKIEIKEYNNQGYDNLDFEFDKKGRCKIIFPANKEKYYEITSSVSFNSNDGCKWSLQKK